MISRKQRDMEQRKALILDLARSKLAKEGYHNLRVDELAKEVGCSKGTIFNDFETKEEIILALAIQSMEQRTSLFRRASSFSGCPRDRILAIGCACESFYLNWPEHFAIEHLIRSTSFWDNTSEERQRLFRGCETQCVSTVGGIVMDAIAQGDLTLPENQTPTDLVYGLWSMTYGAYTLLTTGKEALSTIGIPEPFESLRQNQHRLLDGYGWKPLSFEKDYEAVRAQIQKEIFAH